MDCEVVKQNMGRSRCNKMPEQIRGMITTPDGATIPPATLADPVALEALIQEKLVAPLSERWYKFPNFSTFENTSPEASYEETNTGDYLPVTDGKYRFKFGIRENICTHKAMYTHRAIGVGRVIFYDSTGQLILSENSDGDGQGFALQLLHTEKFIFNDGSVATKSPIVVSLLDNKELDKSGIIVPIDFWTTLYRIVDVVLATVGAIADDEIVVDVAAECDGTAISGLVVGDFSLLEADGSVQVITSATESTTVEGRYTLAGAGGWVDGTLNIKSASALSIKAYDSTGAIAINVP